MTLLPSSPDWGGLGRPLARVLVTEGWGHQRTGRNHEGIDLRASIGTEVMAVHDGRVLFAGEYADGSGKAVELDHGDGIVTRYLHLSRLDVRSGATVPRGARLGASGFAKSPHLHLDCWVLAPLAIEFERLLGPPKGGITTRKIWASLTYMKVPSEPLVPADEYQDDVIAMMRRFSILPYRDAIGRLRGGPRPEGPPTGNLVSSGPPTDRGNKPGCG